MPRMTILGFSVGGVNTDLPQWDLPPNTLSSADNFRCENGSIHSFGGHDDWGTHPASTNLYSIHYVETQASSYWVHCGTATGGNRLFDGTSWYDISNAAGYSGVTDATLWTHTDLGGIPVFNHPTAYPEYWSPVSSSQVLQDLPFDASNTWRAKTYKCKVMRSHRQFLIAFNMTEGANEYPDLVRWSNVADSGGLPDSWDETVVTNQAGTKVLGGDGGHIVDALPLRNGMAIYQENAIWQMDFVGGVYVWNFKQLPVNAGALSTNCVAKIPGGHVILSDGDVLFNDGTNVNSIIHMKLKSRLIELMDVDNYLNSFVTVQRQAKEAWVCIPTNGKTYPDMAFIWNWQDNTWSIRDLPEAPSISFGTYSTGEVGWDDMTMSWIADTGIWGQRNYTPINDILVATLPNAGTPKTVIIDPIQENDGDAFTTTLEKLNFPLEGQGIVTTITRVIPHMTGTKSVTIQLGSHDYAGSPIRWKTKVTFDPETDRKVDIRSTGELHAIRIVGENDPSFMVSGVDIEYEVTGAR